MTNKRDSINALDQALTRLEEALQEDSSNPLMIDGTIQRFEFCYELFWKVLKKLLLSRENIEVQFPKQTFRAAFQLGWLPEGEDIWLQMLNDRNKTSHTYEQSLALQVFTHIRDYAPLLRKTYDTLINQAEPPH